MYSSPFLLYSSRPNAMKDLFPKSAWKRIKARPGNQIPHLDIKALTWLWRWALFMGISTWHVKEKTDLETEFEKSTTVDLFKSLLRAKWASNVPDKIKYIIWAWYTSNSNWIDWFYKAQKSITCFLKTLWQMLHWKSENGTNFCGKW